jgi:hypothetical protein
MPSTIVGPPSAGARKFPKDQDFFPPHDPLSITFVYRYGHHYVVIWWNGRLDFRGSASSIDTAVSLATQRGDFIIRNPATAELTRIPAPAWLIPYCPQETPTLPPQGSQTEKESR